MKAKQVKSKSVTHKRSAEIDRKTAETQISLRLTIEGAGHYKVSTGIRFPLYFLLLRQACDPKPFEELCTDYWVHVRGTLTCECR